MDKVSFALRCDRLLRAKLNHTQRALARQVGLCIGRTSLGLLADGRPKKAPESGGQGPPLGGVVVLGRRRRLEMPPRNLGKLVSPQFRDSLAPIVDGLACDAKGLSEWADSVEKLDSVFRLHTNM